MTNGITRVKSAWNAFWNPTKDTYEYKVQDNYSYISNYRPDRPRLSRGNERSILNTIYNRIATDVAAVTIEHVNMDDNGRFIDIVKSDLNYCLNVEANIDQTGRQFIFDLVYSMLDEGCVASVPIETDIDPRDGSAFSISNIRVGRIVQWAPKHVKVRVYDERTAQYRDIFLPKTAVGIHENPFYSVMNENISTLRRLVKKLNLLDAIDERSGSGKLDLIIQLPYVVKSPEKKKQAEVRRKNVEDQLANSRYGVAYIDSTERVTQLNRAVENNLFTQIQYYTDMLYAELGLTPAVFNGTANEQEMLNYYNRTIEPILACICDEFKRKFLSQNARTRGQSIMYFRDPFRLVPVSQIADIADKMTRNEILTSNEVRQIIGYKPSSEPNADELRNKNLNQSPAAMKEEQMIGREDEILEKTG